MHISAAGMASERTRLETAAMNLANANTVGAVGGPAYQPRQVVVQAIEPSFESQMTMGLNDTDGVRSAVQPLATVVLSPSAPVRRHEPGHPLADAQGFIAQPAVDTLGEMVTVVQALRAYEANVTVAAATRSMLVKTLEIGGNT